MTWGQLLASSVVGALVVALSSVGMKWWDRRTTLFDRGRQLADDASAAAQQRLSVIESEALKQMQAMREEQRAELLLLRQQVNEQGASLNLERSERGRAEAALAELRGEHRALQDAHRELLANYEARGREVVGLREEVAELTRRLSEIGGFGREVLERAVHHQKET